MKRIAPASAAVFVACFGSAALLLVAADHKLEKRTNALLAEHCSQGVDVPAAATVFSWAATILLIVAAASTVVFVVSATRFTSVAVKVVSVVVAAVAFLIATGYALLVGFSLLSPSADEPISPRYHPCAAFF